MSPSAIDLEIPPEKLIANEEISDEGSPCDTSGKKWVSKIVPGHLAKWQNLPLCKWQNLPLKWQKALMGQGPYGPRPIWAPGPWAPGPSLLGKHLTKKRTLEKRVQIVFFVYFLETKKMRDVRTIILAAVSRRDLCYVSENEGFRF